jgi:hypothetical protein
MTDGTERASTSALSRLIATIIRSFTILCSRTMFSADLNLQPDRFSKKAAGSISIVAAWVLVGRPHVVHGAILALFWYLFFDSSFWCILGAFVRAGRH